MPLNRLPEVEKCCICVNDLKSAAAIIAVLGIVTSPSVSWAVIRHSYVIRVSCFVTTGTSRADVVDINLNNIVSFGFGANAGLSPSCLGPKNATQIVQQILRANEDSSSAFVTTVKSLGWIVFLADVFFLLCSVRFLIRIFKGSAQKAAKLFIWAAIVSIILSFLYGMLYVSACLTVGGAFPIFEFAFSIIDVIMSLMWPYFIIVIRAYIRAPHTAFQRKYLDCLTRPHLPISAWNKMLYYITYCLTCLYLPLPAWNNMLYYIRY